MSRLPGGIAVARPSAEHITDAMNNCNKDSLPATAETPTSNPGPGGIHPFQNVGRSFGPRSSSSRAPASRWLHSPLSTCGSQLTPAQQGGTCVARVCQAREKTGSSAFISVLKGMPRLRSRSTHDEHKFNRLSIGTMAT